jgi:hypothetical protein
MIGPPRSARSAGLCRAKPALAAGSPRRYSHPMELVPSDHGWPGLGRFAALSFVLLALTTVALLTVLATAEHDMRTADLAVLVWMFAGLPLLLGLAARRRGLVVAGVTAVVSLFLILATMGLPFTQAAPRHLLGGSARGTIAEVAVSPAAWAEVSPARVWTTRVGTGVYTTMEDGRTQTESRSVSPIVPEIPWSGEVTLFACAHHDDLADLHPDTGTLAGRLAPANDLAGDAVRELADQGLRVGPAPRCLSPTLGGPELTLAFDLVFAGLFVLAAAFAGAWGLVRTALGR